MLRYIWTVIVVFVLAGAAGIPLHAQNTKGDRPVDRETRVQKKEKRVKPANRGRSKRTTSDLRKYKPRKDIKGGERAAKPLGRVRRLEPSRKPRNVYPSRGHYVNNASSSGKRIKAATASERRSAPRTSARHLRRNVYPSKGRFVNSKSISDRRRPAPRKRIEPKSQSRSFIRHRSINSWAQYSRSDTRRTERPHRGDISGRRIRTRNYQSPKPEIVQRPVRTPSTTVRRITRREPEQRKPSARPRIQRRSVNAWARFSRSQPPKERPYRGDIAGRRLRTRNYESRRPPVIDTPAPTRHGATRTRTPEGRTRKLSATPASKRANIYPRSGPFVNNRSRSQQAKERNVTTRRVSPMSSSVRPPDDPRRGKGRARSASRPFLRRKSINVWANFGRQRRKGETSTNRDIAGKRLRFRNYETQRPDVLVNPTSRIQEQRRLSGDRPYDGRAKKYKTATRSGRAWQGDIANRRIRRNYSSKRRIEGEPVLSPEKKRIGMRDQGEGFSGKIRGMRRGMVDQGEEYSGNIKARRPLKGGGSVSGRRWNNEGRAIQGRAPGVGAKGVDRFQGNVRFRRGYREQGEEYSGSIKARRPLKGGGSVSGRRWNNDGRAVQGRAPGIGARGVDRYSGNVRSRRGYREQGEEYSGSIKARRPQKGGGSVSGMWNNDGTPIEGRVPKKKALKVAGYPGKIHRFQNEPGFNNQGEEYTGNIRARRPAKGGGSVTAMWNNDGRAVEGRSPGIGARGVGKYQGNIRAGRRGYQDQGEEYSGNIKARRPAKGGGSISGMWNNDGVPIEGRTPGIGARGVGKYQGNIRAGRRGYQDQGEEYSGNIKTKRPEKGGGSVARNEWNNRGNPVAVRIPKSDQSEGLRYRDRQEYKQNPNASALSLKKAKPSRQTFQVNNVEIRSRREYKQNPNASELSLKKSKPSRQTFQVNKVETRNRQAYARNPNADEESLRTRKPSRNTYSVGDLQVRTRQQSYSARKGAPDGSLKGIRPSAAMAKAGRHSRSVKQTWGYARNPNVASGALRGREPGKAHGRAADYQGNVKLKKFELFKKQKLHPDAQFVKTNKNNVDGERGVMTNFKLWWSRLFKKNATQPDHLKQRDRKPRYDKGEAGLWYD